MARRLWIGGVRKRMQQKGTVGVFSKRAKSLGISTATLARRWYNKAGVWGKRARLAATYAKLPKPSSAARRRGGKKAARTRARR